MIDILKREPVRVVSLSVALAIAIVRTFFGEGLITADTQETLVNFLTTLAPLLMLVVRPLVTPTANSL